MLATMVFVKLVGYLNRGIEFLFYSLFLLVPLVFAGNTSELFEFSKMWLTFGITISIGFLWFSKMIILKRPIFRRTIFDIPIALFLIANLISTLISLDPHISLWGYYSRWNGGLLSIITYIFLFYAFISNFTNKDPEESKTTSLSKKSFFEIVPDGKTIVRNSIIVSLISGFLVILWSIPGHFGYDPTCFVFRGTLDVSCWTDDFHPTVRIFGPLGQPDWLAAYLGILLPITAALIVNQLRKKNLKDPLLLLYSVLFFLFYLALLYSGSRSGIGGTIVSLIIFIVGYIFLNRKNLEIIKTKFSIILIVCTLFVTLFAGVELPNGKWLSIYNLTHHFNEFVGKSTSNSNPNLVVENTTPSTPSEAPSSISPVSQITSSIKIRSIVWRGGMDAWRANPLFGTGVETFAFAYYRYRPIEHNNVSEWNFLYNKAHNEYINYLATIGLFGFIPYISFIGLFIIISLINLLKVHVKPIKYVGSLSASTKWDEKNPLILGLLCAIISNLIINFFGFSVVITNVYLFLIPAFVLILLDLIPHVKEIPLPKIPYVSYTQWGSVLGLFILAIFMIGMLIRFYIADTKYALGFNYNQVGEFQTAYPLLQDALKKRKEPIFQNEAAINEANIAVQLASQGASESAQFIQQLANQSLTTADTLTKTYPHNLIFWKTKVRILYTLARLDPNFYPQALMAIQKAYELAPTDASILYNLGVLYGQNGDSKKAVEVLEQTVKYRPIYTEAHFALGLFYHDLGVDQNGKTKDANYKQKAIDQMQYILKNLNPNDGQAKQYLDSWLKE